MITKENFSFKYMHLFGKIPITNKHTDFLLPLSTWFKTLFCMRRRSYNTRIKGILFVSLNKHQCALQLFIACNLLFVVCFIQSLNPFAFIIAAKVYSSVNTGHLRIVFVAIVTSSIIQLYVLLACCTTAFSLCNMVLRIKCIHALCKYALFIAIVVSSDILKKYIVIVMWMYYNVKGQG